MAGSIPPRRSTRRIVVAAAIGLSVVVATFVAGVLSYASANASVDHTLQVQRSAAEWLTALLDAETGARGFVLAPKNDRFLDPYRSALARERAGADQLKRLVADNGPQMQNVELADQHARVILAHLAEFVLLVREGRSEEAIAELSSDGKSDMDAFRQDIDRVWKSEGRLLVDRRAMARSRATLSLIGAGLLSVGSFGLLAFAWRVQRTRERLLGRLASEARERLAALSDLAVALSGARTRAQVAEVVVAKGQGACGADTCTLHVLDDTGRFLELVGHSGVAPEVIDKIRRIGADGDAAGTLGALRSGETTFVETQSDYSRIYPELAGVKSSAARVQSFCRVPLIAEGKAVGLLGMGFFAPRKFSEDERVFVETLAKQCAQGLSRASRLEREDEARMWFTTTLRSIGDAVIATDAEGRVTFMNPIAETLTGWSESDAHGRPLDEVFCIFSEETGAVVENPVARVLREGNVVGLANHTVLRSKSGIRIPIDDSGAPIRTEGGPIFGVVLVFRDVSHEKSDRARREFLAKAGEALVSSVDYHSMLSAVARVAVPAIADWCVVNILDPSRPPLQAVAHVDPEKVRLAEELGLRYPPDPNAAAGVPNVIRTGQAELYTRIPDALLEQSARSAEHLEMLRELRLESGMIVPLRARGRTIGAMTFIYAESSRTYRESDLAFAEDFARRAALAIENATALKEAEVARARERMLRDQAETASRAKDEFLAMVSHELRTPLTAILGWAVTLRNRGATPEADRALAVIERNARAQAKLIDDVLDVSRIVSGNLALALSPTDIGKVVLASVETVAPAADAKEITISIDVSDEPLTITADVERIQQVAWNLLSNAVKFTKNGGRVAVDVRRDGSDIRLQVRDTGEGIRADVLPFVFDPFRQADASPTRRHGGLGLGLAIVKQLVAAHGGTVQAESEGQDKGATFTVRLPARAVVAAVGRPARGTSSIMPPAAGAPRLDGLRVVVIDDEEDALSLMAAVLRERGAEVTCVASPKEAVARIPVMRPDVIVSDIGMPEMDGYSFIRTIRSLPTEQGGRTPAVALTAYARTEDAQRAFAAGYQMHVAKPVEPVQLATVVANLGGRSLNEA